MHPLETRGSFQSRFELKRTEITFVLKMQQLTIKTKDILGSRLSLLAFPSAPHCGAISHLPPAKKKKLRAHYSIVAIRASGPAASKVVISL